MGLFRQVFHIHIFIGTKTQIYLLAVCMYVCRVAIITLYMLHMLTHSPHSCHIYNINVWMCAMCVYISYAFVIRVGMW